MWPYNEVTNFLEKLQMTEIRSIILNAKIVTFFLILGKILTFSKIKEKFDF